MSSSTAVTLFVSYAHEDEDLREELVKHLKLLQRQGVIEGWYDRLIQGGQEWDQEIQTRLLTSNIILLLVSADFLASDYCWDKEVQQAMERHTRGDAVVIPIILRACDWNSAPFGKIQALPRDARPVMSWSDRDEALLDIARGIRQVALRIQARLTQEQRKSEEIEKLRSRLPELMDRDHLHQARDTLRELEKLGWKGADFEDWRERIDEAIRREEKTADWLDSAIRASEGEHYEEALKYLEKAASLSPDHSGIQKLRTAVESRQQKLTSRAVPLHSGDPSAPTNQEDRAREEEPREKTGPAFPSAEEEGDGQTPNQVELKAPSLLSSTSEEDVARGAERDSELPALASRVLSLFRTRSRLQMTGGFLIVFVAVLLFYRMGPATGDQNGGDQVAPGLELSGSRAVLDTSSSDELDSAGDRLAGKDRSPAGKSNTGSPVPLTGTEVASRTDQQEASTETSGQLGESSTPPTDVAATAPSVPPPSTTTDQSSIRTPIRNADADSTNDVASGSRAQVASQPDPLAGNWLKVGFDGLQKDSRQEIARKLRDFLVSAPENGRANLYLAMICLTEGTTEQARHRLRLALSANLTPDETKVAQGLLWKLPHSYPVEHLHPSLSEESESRCTGILSFDSNLVSFKPASGDEEQIAVKVPAVRRAEFERGTLRIHLQGGRPLAFRFSEVEDLKDVHAVLIHGYGFSGQ